MISSPLGKYDSDDVAAFIKESMHMKCLDHPNVMKLIGVCFDAGTAPYIILPYMSGKRQLLLRSLTGHYIQWISLLLIRLSATLSQPVYKVVTR